MGYHINEFPKGDIGFISKVEEEVNEFKDAVQQECIIMATIELSDIYGALEEVARNYNLTMNDLRIMSDITKRAFRDGSRT